MLCYVQKKKKKKLGICLVVDVTQEVDLIGQGAHFVLEVSLDQIGRVHILDTNTHGYTLC